MFIFVSANLQKNFVEVFIEIMFLYVSVRKVNFTQMGKYGRHCEQTYHNNFTKDVDWVAAIKETGADLSVGEYMALMHSSLIFQRIICGSGINLDPAINRKVMNELVMLAKNAARHHIRKFNELLLFCEEICIFVPLI